ERGEAIVRCGTEIAKIKTLGPLEIPEQNFKDLIIAESRKKYCTPASEVHRIIEQRRERANKPFAPLGVVADDCKKPSCPENSNMMSSDLEKLARKTITAIMVELDPDRIADRFDNPIAKAAREFDYEPQCPITYKEFHRIAACFVEHIYDKAMAASWMLTDPLAEVIWLLEDGYESAAYGAGYVAALLDANDPAEGGIQTVLTGLAELIRDSERQKYIKAVFARYLSGCSWALRCEIARLLLQDYRPFLPERLGKCAPAQLADEIASVISMFISANSILQQGAFSSDGPVATETSPSAEPL
ncbi:MAG: hypothetical protein AB1649_25000, partial [Chloroflexota bacterium]